MSFTKTLLASIAIIAMTLTAAAQAATVIPIDEDVMTSAFFFGPNFVRGYPGEGRIVHRVSSDNAFDVGPETIYLTFDSASIGALTGPIANATLTVQSADGGFGANAGPGNPFTVSAHAVDSDPLTSITDDTNPGGPIAWLDFFNNNILAADPAALTAVDAINVPIEFDVTAVVNDWIVGTNTVFALALTGKNDTSGGDFLHGFLNNSENPSSTFLTVTAVPEPSSVVLFGLAAVAALAHRKGKKFAS